MHYVGFHSYNTFITQIFDLGGKTPSTAKDFENAPDFYRQERQHGCMFFNGLNLLGYVPIGGIFAGYNRITMLASEAGSLVEKIYLYTRSIFEMLGLALLFLPIDFGVSLYRQISYDGPNFTPPTTYPLNYLDYFKYFITRDEDCIKI